MNRPRIVGMLSAALGSTAGFLILSRWSLAGTITGAILMPVIFTLVSFGSHETLERSTKWLVRRLKREQAESEPETVHTEEAEMSSAKTVTPRARGLQWAAAILALLAFSFSLYSLTQDDGGGLTILREKVIETVTVTSDQPAIYVARNPSDGTTETTDPSAALTTTTTAPADPDGLPVTTVPTTVGSDNSTTTTLSP